MHPMIRFSAAALAPFALSACVTMQAPPSVGTSVSGASMYMFRGVPQVDDMVFQGDLSVSVSDDAGGTYSMTAWANMDGSNDTGDAVFPNGNDRKITEFDLVPEYSRSCGNLSTAVGITNYNFPNGVGGSTSELYASVSYDTMLNPSIVANWDFDAVEGVYVQVGLSEGWELAKDTALEVGVAAGYADEDQGLAYWGAKSSGISHVEGYVSVTKTFTDRLNVFASVSGASIVEDDYEKALDAALIETDNVWFMLGLGWGI